MFEQLLYVCNELKEENEIAIINKYGCNGKCYTMILTGKKFFFNLHVWLYFYLITQKSGFKISLLKDFEITISSLYT